MEVATLVFPVFAIIITGWLSGWLGYIPRSLSEGLVLFAYNVAMPALLLVTIAQESAHNLLEWRFLLAFGGGSMICFVLVFFAVRIGLGRSLASSTIYGMTAAMTNTGFVALPILHSLYGQPAVLPAAVATVFVAAVMFPITVILLEGERVGTGTLSGRLLVLARHILINPLVLSTLAGLAWAIGGFPVPKLISAYMNILAAALTPCALFAIGLGISVEGVRSSLAPCIALSAIKLLVMPLIVYGLCAALGLKPLYSIAAVVCAAVPTAKTMYILASQYKVEEPLVGATVSITTLLSVATLLGWLFVLSGLAAQAGQRGLDETHWTCGPNAPEKPKSVSRNVLLAHQYRRVPAIGGRAAVPAWCHLTTRNALEPEPLRNAT
jgi:predicted permease